MKFPVHVLAWSLSTYVAVAKEEKIAAEAEIKQKLLERDEEKYKDAVIHLSIEKEPFLKQTGENPNDPNHSKKKNLRKAVSGSAADAVGSGITDDTQSSDEEIADSGSLRMYQISAPSAGLADGSAVSVEDGVERMYMIIDREYDVKAKEGKEATSPRMVDGEVDQQSRRRATRKGRGPTRRKIGRRNGIRARNTKAGSKSTKSSSSKNRILPNGCVQGSSSFVTQTCHDRQLECCEGDRACEWLEDETITVCPESCNGDLACRGVGDGTFIGPNSCNAEQACENFAEFSKKQKSSIGRNSCNFRFACENICDYSEDCEAAIGDNACNGVNACADIGSPFGSNTQINRVRIGNGSCSTYGTSFATASSCSYVGGYAKSVDIGFGSCRASNACYNVGYYSEKSVKIGDNSCSAEQACRELAYNTEKKVEIGDSACTLYKSCYYFAYNIEDDNVKIEDDQCTAIIECAGSRIPNLYNQNCLNTKKVPNKDGLCPLAP